MSSERDSAAEPQEPSCETKPICPSEGGGVARPKCAKQSQFGEGSGIGTLTRDTRPCPRARSCETKPIHRPGSIPFTLWSQSRGGMGGTDRGLPSAVYSVASASCRCCMGWKGTPNAKSCVGDPKPMPPLSVLPFRLLPLIEPRQFTRNAGRDKCFMEKGL